jgi:hypothetical protein
VGAQVVDETEDFVTSRGTFYDLEKNVALQFDVKRRIKDKKGRRYSADMIAMTSTAASSIALRNAILKGVPKAFWKGLFLAAKQVITGKIETLATRRQEKISLFKPFGVTPDMLYKVLGVKGISEVSLEHLAVLTGMLNSLKEGEMTVEAMFSNVGQVPDQAVAAKAETELERVKRKYVRKSDAERERLEVEKIKRNRLKIMQERERAAKAPAPEIVSGIADQVQQAQAKLEQRREEQKKQENLDAEPEIF